MTGDDLILATLTYYLELSEGWEPICRIIGKPIPKEPFPKANDAEAIDALAGKILIEAGWRWGVVIVLMGALSYGLSCALFRRQVLIAAK
tara:strand:- start:3397 stop:3666 length:270 start_codon:yes stop_codon:yes gene_type:complete